MSKKSFSKNKKNQKQQRSHKVNYHPAPKPYDLKPPTYVQQVVRSWIVRGTVTGGLWAGSISNISFCAFMGIIATGATTSSFISDQFRVKRICAWSPPAAIGSSATCVIKYTDDPASNTQSGAPKTVSDTTISPDLPAYACLEPPRDNSSIFSQWWDSSLTTTMVNVSIPVNSVVDIDFQFILDDIGATTAGPTIVGGTAGNIYHHPIVAGAGTLTVVGQMNSA